MKKIWRPSSGSIINDIFHSILSSIYERVKDKVAICHFPDRYLV